MQLGASGWVLFTQARIDKRCMISIRDRVYTLASYSVKFCA